MASKAVFDPATGALKGVYDDKWRVFFESFGMPLNIKRASEVEFDESTQEWYAKYLATGEEIARGSNRAEVIRLEVEWLEQHVIV